MKNIRGSYPLIHGNLFYYEFNVVQRKKWLFVDQYNVDILVRNKVQLGLGHNICVKSRARNNKFQSASHEIYCFQTPKSTENAFKKTKKKQNKKAKTKEYIFKTSNFNILRLILERGQVEDEWSREHQRRGLSVSTQSYNFRVHKIEITLHIVSCTVFKAGNPQ